MRDADIDALQASLLRNGIQPRYACRVAEELRAHVQDLRDAYLAEGFDAEQADRRASRSIGRPEDLIEAMTARRELKTWAFRFPFLAVMFYPLACLVALPAEDQHYFQLPSMETPQSVLFLKWLYLHRLFFYFFF